MSGRRIVVVALAIVLLGVPLGCGDDGSSAEPPSGSKVVRIDGPEGAQLRAREVGEGKVAVVLAHGASTNMTSWYAPMDELADAGYRVIAFDSRGVGESTGTASTDPVERVADLEAVVAHARDTGAQQVVVMGSSLGAQAALLVAEAGEADAVVGVSPATVPEGVGTITVPAFFVAAEGDTGPADNARDLGRLLGSEVDIVGGSVHGADLFTDDPDAVRALVRFVSSAVPAR